MRWPPLIPKTASRPTGPHNSANWSATFVALLAAVRRNRCHNRRKENNYTSTTQSIISPCSRSISKISGAFPYRVAEDIGENSLASLWRRYRVQFTKLRVHRRRYGQRCCMLIIRDVVLVPKLHCVSDFTRFRICLLWNWRHQNNYRKQKRRPIDN